MCGACTVKYVQAQIDRELKIQQLRKALQLARTEMMESGNWHAKNDGWPAAQRAVEAALAEPVGKPNTNEFWADGMRVGKAVGFKNGIEAAKEKLRRTGFKNVDEFFADLSPAPTAPRGEKESK
jgi:hypothetical protein